MGARPLTDRVANPESAVVDGGNPGAVVGGVVVAVLLLLLGGDDVVEEDVEVAAVVGVTGRSAFLLPFE
jgi:hypothetical protein